MNERNQNKNKTSHIIFKLTLRSIVWFRPETMHWYHNGFTDWRQILKEDFLSIIINVWLSMMSGNSANLIFCNNNKKDWTSRTLANPHPSPLCPITSYFRFISYPPQSGRLNTALILSRNVFRMLVAWWYYFKNRQFSGIFRTKDQISDNSIQINIKFTFTVCKYIIVYEYILSSNFIYVYIYIDR